MSTAIFEFFNSAGRLDFQSLISVSVMGSLVVLLALVLHHILKSKVSARWMYLLWLIVIFRFVLFTVPQSPTSVLNLFSLTETSNIELAQQIQSSAMELPVSETSYKEPVVYETIKLESTSNLSGRSFESTPSSLNFWKLAEIIWLIGVAWMSISLVTGFFRVTSMVRSAQQVSPNIEAIFKDLKHQNGIRSSVTIGSTDEIDVPAMLGCFRPVVLLPTWCERELTQRQLEMVLLHELVHIKRRDGLIQLAAYLVSVIHWFNPLVRIATRYVESCRELSCDNRVIERLSGTDTNTTMRIYAETILQIAERASVSRRISPVVMGGFIGTKENLVKQRIAMLVQTKRTGKWIGALAILSAVMLVAIGYTAAQTVNEEISEHSLKTDVTSTQEAASTDQATSSENQQAESFWKRIPDSNSGLVKQQDTSKPKPDPIIESKAEVSPEDLAWQRLGLKLVPTKLDKPNQNYVRGLRVVSVCTKDPSTKSIFNVNDILVGMAGWKTESFENLEYILKSKQVIQATEQRVYIIRSGELFWGKINPTEWNTGLTPELPKVANNKSDEQEKTNLKNATENSIQVTVDSSAVIQFDFKIPQLMVDSPEVVKVIPIAPTELLITGIKSGTAKVNVHNEKGDLATIYKIVVLPNPIAVNQELQKRFPFADLKVENKKDHVVLAGRLEKESIAEVISVVQDMCGLPIVNQITTDNRMLAFGVKVYEVSKPKLKQLGVQFPGVDAGEEVHSIAQLIQLKNSAGKGSMSVDVVGDGKLQGFVEGLCKKGVAKLLDQPTLVAKQGRRAEFLSGGEVPIETKDKDGNSKIEFRSFGTKISILPQIQGEDDLTLEVLAELSEIAEDMTGKDGRPGFRVRRVNTGITMKAKQTFVIAGDYRDTRIAGDSDETEMVVFIIPRLLENVTAKIPKEVEPR